jgi:ABC-2 type transport system ATP-binding protein
MIDLRTPSATRDPATRPTRYAQVCLTGQDLTKRYGKVQALSSASIALERGVVRGLVGPNGAGKTTLIRILLGDLRPDEGSVEFHSADVPPRSPGTGIGAVTEQLGLDTAMTAGAAIHYFRRAGGFGREAVDEVVETTSLAPLFNKTIKSMSTGQRRRIELALALLGDPECLIFDEPLNGLDPDSIEWFRQLTDALKRRGKAILVSSHILYELGRVSDEITVIHQGIIRYSGPVDSAADVESIYQETKEQSR